MPYNESSVACGRCIYWMSHDECPKEAYIEKAGVWRGPAMSDSAYGCPRFKRRNNEGGGKSAGKHK